MEDSPPSSHDSFKERLSAARTKQGLEKQTNKEDDTTTMESTGSLVAFALRLATEMLSAVIVGLVIGWGLDYWLQTGKLFLIFFSFLGIASGVLNIWRLTLKR